MGDAIAIDSWREGIAEAHSQGKIPIQLPIVSEKEVPVSLPQVTAVRSQAARGRIGDPQKKIGKGISREIAGKSEGPAPCSPGSAVVKLFEMNISAECYIVVAANIGVICRESIIIKIGGSGGYAGGEAAREIKEKIAAGESRVAGA